MRTGWSIEAASNYDLPVPGELSSATRLVVGICSGLAEEFALIDPDGN
jgi:hypothetical protein